MFTVNKNDTRLSTVFIVNFGHISSVYTVELGQVDICWVPTYHGTITRTGITCKKIPL